MSFLLAFLQAIVVVFTIPLVLSWVVLVIGDAKGNNYQDKAHNILTFVFAGGLIFGILGASTQVANPIFVLLPAAVVLVAITALRLKYEEDYEFSRFVKTFSIKLGMALLFGFANINN